MLEGVVFDTVRGVIVSGAGISILVVAGFRAPMSTRVRMAISLGVRRLMVYGDSDLVVKQVMKEWDVRSPTMTGYCNAVRKLEKRIEGLELHHIPRLKNQAVDDLAKIASK